MDDPRFGLLSRLFDENNLKAAGPPRKSVLVIVDDADDYGLDDARRYFANNGLAVEFARVADFDDKGTPRAFDSPEIRNFIGFLL